MELIYKTLYSGLVLMRRNILVDLLNKQNNKCAICNLEFNSTNKKISPVLDHDHSTGKMRSALCCGCNTRLGKIENPMNGWTVSFDIKPYIEYLKSHNKILESLPRYLPVELKKIEKKEKVRRYYETQKNNEMIINFDYITGSYFIDNKQKGLKSYREYGTIREEYRDFIRQASLCNKAVLLYSINIVKENEYGKTIAVQNSVQ